MSNDDPYSNRENFKAGMFYYNLDDNRVLIRVPGTANRYNFNYARWQTYLIIIPILGIFCYGFFASRR